MADTPKAVVEAKRPLRSRLWFDNPDNPGMTALYIERYLNFGLTPAAAIPSRTRLASSR
jgi:dihydroxy-acid dehydratase